MISKNDSFLHFPFFDFTFLQFFPSSNSKKKKTTNPIRLQHFYSRACIFIHLKCFHQKNNCNRFYPYFSILNLFFFFFHYYIFSYDWQLISKAHLSPFAQDPLKKKKKLKLAWMDKTSFQPFAYYYCTGAIYIYI